MEKIYVDQEQQQRKQKRNRKFNSLNISLGLSFAVAFVAIASILFVSLSGTSYAVDDQETLPKDLTTMDHLGTDILTAVPTTGTHGVTVYHAKDASDNQYLVYCLESNIHYVANADLSWSKDIEDYGLIYLTSKLNNITVSTSDFGGISATDAEKIKYWITQTAIWSYLGKAQANPTIDAPEFINGSAYEAAKNVKSLNYQNDGATPGGSIATSNTEPFFTKYNVVAIIDKALDYHKKGIDPLVLKINKAGGNFSLAEGDKYLRSPKLTVSYTPAEDGLSSVKDNYSLSLVGAPEGSYIEGINKATKKAVKLSADDLKNLKLSEYTEFYVVVPKDKITEANKKFVVNTDGNFEVLTGYYYSGEKNGTAAQTITTLKKITVSRNDTTQLQVTYAPDVPNTAVSVSQSIYLIGLIVLLSGLGILYVNVKKQQKQN